MTPNRRSVGAGVRSLLYVPGDNEHKLAKALGTGADALIADLEDSVPASAKNLARSAVASWLRARDQNPGGPQLWARVNAGEEAAQDIQAVTCAALSGIVVAKCESKSQLRKIDALLAAAERRVGLPAGTIAVSALIESAEGMLAIADIAAAPRVLRLQLGEVDLCADMDMTPDASEQELLPLRLQVVLASAAARLCPPAGPVFRSIDDLPALRASTQRLRRLGFAARSVVHPKHVPVVNEVLGPGELEVARARKTLADFARHQAAGVGAYRDDQGRMVDQAVVRVARRVVDQAEAGGSGAPGDTVGGRA
jgi:citrate lyase subunit beta / citryl-CoA lyase